MIEQQACVVAVNGDAAVVETTRAEHCEACAAGRGCGAGLFVKLLSRRVTRLEVPNALGAAVGERVTVGVDERRLVQASLRLYGTFLMALVGGAAAGHAVAMARDWPADPIAVVGAVVAIAGGMLFLRYKPAQIRAQLVRSREYSPET